nr:reverse transcriptase domain-containing protein [Tanacetum cinerariifolium]
MAEKVHQEKLQGVQTRLNFRESSQRNLQFPEKSNILSRDYSIEGKKSKKRRKLSPSTMSRSSYPSQSLSVFSRLKHEDPGPSRRMSPASTHVFTRLGERERIVFTWLGNKEPDVFSRLGSRDLPHYRHANSRRHASSKRTKREIRKGWDAANRANRKTPTPVKEAILSESKNSEGGHWKSRPKKLKFSTNEDDLSKPWLCEETDPFIPQTPAIDQKQDDLGHNLILRIQWRDLLATRTYITTGVAKRQGTFNQHLDELHGSHMPIPIQWHYQRTMDKEDSSRFVYSSPNV